MKRVLTTITLLPIFVFIVVSKVKLYFFILTFLGAAIAQFEFQKILELKGIKSFKIFSLVWTFSFLFVSIFPKSLQLEPIIFIGFTLLAFFTLLQKGDFEERIKSFCFTLFGVFYIGFFLAYFIALKSTGDERGKDLLLLLTFTVWAGDTMAYVIGSKIGKNKLAPNLSPKKSVEGAIANVIASVLTAYISSITFIQSIGMRDVIILGIMISFLGQIGDLFESLFKRWAQIKDSSSLLPGHGGILDRMDSLILTAPLLYYYHQVFLK